MKVLLKTKSFDVNWFYKFVSLGLCVFVFEIKLLNIIYISILFNRYYQELYTGNYKYIGNSIILAI
jgi:hypothetical protein